MGVTPTWQQGMPASTPGAAVEQHDHHGCSMTFDSLFDDEAGGPGCVLIEIPDMQQEAGIEPVDGDAGFRGPTGVDYTLGTLDADAVALKEGLGEGVTAADIADHQDLSHEGPQSSGLSQGPELQADASGAQSTAQHDAAGASGASISQHSMLGRGHAGHLRFWGVGGRLAPGRTTALAQMGPAERAAWAAVAKQRQQLLYGRFIELALQGQHAAAVQGHCGLNQLMELVRSCIQEEVQDSHGASGSSAGGSNGGNRALNVMALIKKVQLCHQQMLLQKQQQGAQPQGMGQPAVDAGLQPSAIKGCGAAAADLNKAGQSGATAAAAATPVGDSLGALVARQRLFVAFLNVAHQSNLAAAAARSAGAATAGASVVAAGLVPVGCGDGGGVPGHRKTTHKAHAGNKRTHTGQIVACGSTARGEQALGHQQQQQQGTLSAWALGTKIFLT
jgi:hypothetical protein